MPRFAVAVLLGVAAACAACGGGQHTRAAKTGEEYLADIQITGNKGIPNDDLIPGLALRRTAEAGRPVDPFVLANDVTRIRGAYVRLGYFAVDVRATLQHAGLATTVVFVVTEGPRATTQVQLLGLPTTDPKVTADVLRKLVPLKEGAPFDYDVYDDAKKTLLAAIEDAGYAHAQLGATVLADKTSGVAILRYIFDPGVRCTFGTVTISGAPGDLEEAVSARLGFRTGELYSASAIAKTQRSLYELNRFSTVRIEPATSDPAATVIAVKISVSIGARHEFHLGGGFGYEPLTYDLRGRIGYSIAGCIDALTTCSTDFKPAITLNHINDFTPDFSTPEPKIRALASLQRLDFLRPFITGDAEIGYDYLTLEAYTYTGPHARLGISTPLGVPWLVLHVGWLFEFYGFINIDQVVDDGARSRLGLEGIERMGAYQQSLIVDLRDSPIAPHKGIYLEARAAEGTELAGGAYDFTELVPDLRGYIPLWHWVLAGRVRAGEIFGDIAPTERFFAGGASSQRGFSERRLAPTITGFVPDDPTLPRSPSNGSIHSVPVGGAVLVDTSVELRTPPADIFGLDLAAVAFVDYGDNTETRADMHLGDLHLATGGGIRIPTPVGAIRIDVGYRLDRTGPREPEPTGLLRPFAIHFGIGEAY